LGELEGADIPRTHRLRLGSVEATPGGPLHAITGRPEHLHVPSATPSQETVYEPPL